MEPKELCKNFLDADKIINDENDNNLAHRQIINDPKFKEYCSNIDCETDMQINGFGEYLFNQLGTQIENEYYEYFMMWLSDKLFEIAKEDDESQIEDITLNSAYEKYLKKNIKNGIYWSLLDIKKELKEVNLKYMKQFYKLLNHICEAIVYYNSSKDDTEKFINYSSDCSNQYLSIYNSVPKCDSYLHLLDNLKKTYEGFKNSVHDEIKNNYPDLEGRLKTLTIENTSSYFVEKLKEFDFSDPKCKLETKLPPLPPQPQQAKPVPESPQLPSKSTTVTPPPVLSKEPTDTTQQAQLQSSLQKDNGLQKTQTEGPHNKNGSEDSKSGQIGLDSGKGITDGGGEKGDPDHGKGGTNNVSGSTGGGSGSGASGGQVGTDSGTGSGKGGTKGKSGPPDSGQGVITGDPKSGTSSVQSDQGGSPVGSGSQGGSSNQKGSDDRSKTSGDPIPPHSSGASNGYFPSIWGMNFNFTSYMPNVSGIYQSSKDIITSATNQITSKYNSAKAIAQDTYDNAVTAAKNTYDNAMTTIKGAYSATTNYISDGFSSITSQLRSLVFFSQLGNDQSGSGSLGGGTDTSDQSQLKSPPPLQSPLPQSQFPSVTSPPSQTPLQPPSNQAPYTSQGPSSQKQPSSTRDSQDTVKNGTSNIVQQPDPDNGTGGIKTLTIPQVRLLSYGISPSNIGNGNNPLGADAKINEKSSIWCIAQNKKYNILGIGIISISIFAFLAIMYKYLSLGCTSKSKRKKSMKKVINSIGGKRPIQIIIKSYDRKKDLKPVINSVGRKKDPTLNIYKLMQADPIPFINLFFLLIFFVYKRQLNYLEL
ncbi:PIR protein CIR protein [Plasmodium vinckei brucechwatti]|uniref:PIR protein CIR protein n=1 Tax=Plasmodium vinckei brucechwatti TaxID=119398 RepID=A0A6V7RT77_PLAVN|nr:PIR protein CIR protein [Plasmodium vinckei brucechwatti]